MEQEDFIVLAILLGTFLPLVLAVALIQSQARWRWIGWAVAYLVADFVALNYGYEAQRLLPGLHWNWLGKFAALLVGIFALLRWPFLRAESGLTWRQQPGSHKVTAGAALLLLSVALYLGMNTAGIPASVETVLFELSMPSLSEELVFRGILLALLTRALGDIRPSGRLHLSWGCPLLIVYFGLGHAIYWAQGGLHFSTQTLVFTGAVGAVLMLVRARTGSLLAPVLLHSLFNVLVTGVPMLR